MLHKELEIEGRDIGLSLLDPLRTRNTKLEKSRGFKRILASVQTLGLIEPLCVYPEGERYVILDGFLRMKACESLGVETVPCLIYPDKEAYTYNRMVNKLSPVQENRMIKKALETLDKKTITQALGIARLECRLTDPVLQALAPEVVTAIEKGNLSKSAGVEFVHVVPDRQREILREMEKKDEYSPRFARAMILRTPEEQRSGWKGRAAPWKRDPERKKEMAARLEQAEEKHDFFSRLYRDYTSDLMKMSIYARKLITNERIEAILRERHPEILERLRSIVFQEKDTAVA